MIHLHFRGATQKLSWEVLGKDSGVQCESEEAEESSRGGTGVGRWYGNKDKAVHGVPLAKSGTFLLFLPDLRLKTPF